MKRLLFFVSMQCFFVSNFYSQDTINVLYDKNWKEVKTREEAAYYRIAFKNEEGKWEAYDYFMSGVLQMIGAYSDKKMTTKEGSFVFFYENGNKSEESFYSNGKLNGLLTAFYDNGNVKRKAIYVDGKKNGESSTWSEKGVKISEGLFVNGFEEGVWTIYHENGKKKALGNITLGKLDGYWIYWFNNDSVQGKGKFVIDKKDSIWVHYNEFGNLTEIDSFVDRELAGARGFHYNGKLSYYGNYSSGKKTGAWHFFNDKGELIFVGNFVKGKKDGEWIRYFPDGKVMKIFYKEDNAMNKDLGSVMIDE
ncbi:MAG: toxin-antitoxin system YwqK family antitoxin [Chitinophagales bacterium]|nr:toxin-antitoxin system YwqK family antitoxin [Chitinophagales bacterium]